MTLDTRIVTIGMLMALGEVAGKSLPIKSAGKDRLII